MRCMRRERPVEKGIVPGGGVALLRPPYILSAQMFAGGEKIGIAIVSHGCEEPTRQIAINAT